MLFKSIERSLSHLRSIPRYCSTISKANLKSCAGFSNGRHQRVSGSREANRSRAIRVEAASFCRQTRLGKVEKDNF